MKKFIAILKIFLLFAFCLIARTVPAQYACTVKNYNTNNGLSQNTITGMTIDNAGYLWLGTQNGLIRYDGVNFNAFLFDKKGTDPTLNNVQDIMNIMPDGKILVRTRNGVVYTIKKGNPVFYSDSVKNTIYYYDVRGYFPSLSLFDKFNVPIWKLTTFEHWDPRKLYILPVNKTDFLIAGENKRTLLYYKNGIKQKDIPIENEFWSFFRSNGYCFMRDLNSNFYLFDVKAYRFRKINPDLSFMKKAGGDTKNLVFFPDTYSGNTWCFYNSTFYLTRFRPAENIMTFIPEFSINDKGHVWTGVVYDSASSVFFLSTLNEGLFKVRLTKIQTFNLAEKEPKNLDPITTINYSVLKTSDSTALTPAGFQFSINSSGIDVKKLGNIFGNRETIGQMPNGNIVCGSANNVFYYLRSEGFSIPHAYNDSFNKTNKSYVMLVHPEGDSVWVSTNRAIYCLTKEKTKLLFERSLDEKSLYFGLHLFQRINNDEAFISNALGFYKIKTSPPYTIDTLAEMNGKHVRNISWYKDVMILSVYKNGLYILKDNKFYKVPVSADQPELKTCHSTYIDKNENIWIATDKGLFKSTASSVADAALHPGNIPFFFYYGNDDGITNTEFNGAGAPSYAVLKNGQIFYPSMGGIVSFRPEDMNEQILKAPALIEKIIVNNKEADFTNDSIRLHSDFKYLTVYFGVSHFGDTRNLILDYSLDNDEWKRIPSINNLQITLVDISSGKHLLFIRKRTGFGNKDYAYTTLSIYKEKHIYERLWFYPALFLLFILLVWLLLRWKTQNINSKREHLQKLVDTQTAELSQSGEVKDLLISIISHDMITPLRHVSLVSDILGKGLEKDPEKINAALADIKSTSDRILFGSLSIINWMKYNNKKIPINKKSIHLFSLINNVLEIYIPIAKRKNIELINAISKSKFAEADYNVLSIILTNIVSNAVKYTDSGSIKISVEISDNHTTTILKVTDTGKGMNEQTLQVIGEVLKGNLQVINSTDKGSTGLGYVMISELLKIHQLKISIDSKVNEGTTVSIII